MLVWLVWLVCLVLLVARCGFICFLVGWFLCFYVFVCSLFVSLFSLTVVWFESRFSSFCQLLVFFDKGRRLGLCGVWGFLGPIFWMVSSYLLGIWRLL